MIWILSLYHRLLSGSPLGTKHPVYRELADARRQMRIAVGMACQAQERAAATDLQLVACRAILATAMRDRDHYEAAVEVLARELAQLKMQRRAEVAAQRFWLTRTIAPQKGSEN